MGGRPCAGGGAWVQAGGPRSAPHHAWRPPLPSLSRVVGRITNPLSELVVALIAGRSLPVQHSGRSPWKPGQAKPVQRIQPIFHVSLSHYPGYQVPGQSSRRSRQSKIGAMVGRLALEVGGAGNFFLREAVSLPRGQTIDLYSSSRSQDN